MHGSPHPDDGWNEFGVRRIVPLPAGERPRARRMARGVAVAGLALAVIVGGTAGVRWGSGRARAARAGHPPAAVTAAGATRRAGGEASAAVSAVFTAPLKGNYAFSADPLLPGQYAGDTIIHADGSVIVLSPSSGGLAAAAAQAAQTAADRAAGALSLIRAAEAARAQVGAGAVDPSAAALIIDSANQLQAGAATELDAADSLFQRAQIMAGLLRAGASAPGAASGALPPPAPGPAPGSAAAVALSAQVQTALSSAQRAIAAAASAIAAAPTPAGAAEGP